MAVYNGFVNADRIAGRLQDPLVREGTGVKEIVEKFESAAAHDDGSVYGVFEMRSNAVPLPGGSVKHDNITGGTGFEYGLYKMRDNVLVAVDSNIFKASATHANTTANDPFELALTVDNQGLKLWELLGLTEDPHLIYVWAITGVTVGDGGTFNVNARFAE